MLLKGANTVTQKPKIQYVGMFYVHGSEAKKLQEEQRRKEARTKLPLERLRKMEAIYIDPVALISIAVAVLMLVTMVYGALRITRDWAEYRQMSAYVSEMNLENANLYQEYRENIDLEDVYTKAVALGMLPVEEVPTRTITVHVPEAPVEPTWRERATAFFTGLFA